MYMCLTVHENNLMPYLLNVQFIKMLYHQHSPCQ